MGSVLFTHPRQPEAVDNLATGGDDQGGHFCFSAFSPAGRGHLRIFNKLVSVGGVLDRSSPSSPS